MIKVDGSLITDLILNFNRKGNVMRNNFFTFIGIVLLCGAMVLTCTGCENKSAYAAKVITNDQFADDSVQGAFDTGITTISVGDFTYNVKWEKSVRSNLNDELYDYYEVVDNQNKLLPGTIDVDPKTGEVLFFSQITPFSRIENIASLSDEELRSAAEQLLGGLADFSQYNTFEVARPIYNNGFTDTCLSWNVKRDILCNINVTVYISEDGLINCFSKTDACPDGTAESFVPNEERIKLLETEICRYLGVKSINSVNYEILFEKLSLSHNESCIYYTVKITDEAGFSELIVLSVFKR